ncbi:hypothetical protein DS909_03265 [Phaeobacter gallaeciensis]|uniref:Uncharacterized protein n=2 Tax=Roseobacteraceae TaxID=2854170 RepID=A0A366X6E2_9RHOB|nr:MULTISPECIES: hypothetical protein [Roseobacteraceae]MBT3142554.1 hypothetical protein [Falsiruegeria litorea]MBT8169218.1 hypothetical protein [Falsiruegeria litorea]RBW60683.1 hypothetical protein DS909_03265 [Phaeobacter gallaeciensis]
MFQDLYLTPLSGSIILFIVVVSGHLYRQNWKSEKPNTRLRAWAYGLPAAIGLMALAFLPLKY